MYTLEEAEEAFYIRVPSPIGLIGWNIQRKTKHKRWGDTPTYMTLSPESEGIVANTQDHASQGQGCVSGNWGLAV